MDLSARIESLAGIGPSFSTKLRSLGVENLYDLLTYLPFRYDDRSQITPISQIKPGQTVTLVGTLSPVKSFVSKNGKKLQAATISDATGKFSILWFNQTYLSRVFYKPTQVTLYGKVEFYAGKPALFAPQYDLGVETGILPIYHETAGLSSKWLRGKIASLINQIPETIFPFHPQWRDDLQAIHFPKSLAEVENVRQRLAMDEMVVLQMASLQRRQIWQATHIAPKLLISDNQLDKFLSALPFTLTASQQKAIADIKSDLEKDISMNRLLLGDVGSGKTVVAAAAALVAVKNNFQVAFLAPTQILAQQHYQTLTKLFEPLGISVALVTSKSKLEISNSKLEIVVGTQSLLSEKLQFDHLGLVVIDEQHRFGVDQRQILAQKGTNPHVLTMTATPIPRTVALTKYSDLELSELVEKPKDRKAIKTWVVPEDKRLSAYDWIKKQSGQIFWVCPLIEESETLTSVKSVKAEFASLQKIFSGLTLGLLHGKMKASEKDEVVEKFRQQQIDMLVTTPVVEVGVDIPGATIMVIEAAERFGLASLHQLRGRVGRNNVQSYCLLFANTGVERLKNLEVLDSGLQLAELDFRLRGPGTMTGTSQHGQSEFKIAVYSDLLNLPQAKITASHALMELEKWPFLRQITNPAKIEASN